MDKTPQRQNVTGLNATHTKSHRTERHTDKMSNDKRNMDKMSQDKTLQRQNVTRYLQIKRRRTQRHPDMFKNTVPKNAILYYFYAIEYCSSLDDGQGLQVCSKKF